GPGDKVITTPFTFFATAGSIARLNAVPLFVDIHPKTFNIDPDSLEHTLRKKAKGAKAVIPVHLYGQCADMAPIMSLAGKYGLVVIEDAAQSIGAAYRGRKAGALGHMGCFSFYPTKNLRGLGDGGMVTTDNSRLSERLKTLRVHGSRKRYYHDEVGVNSRLDEIQAAVLRVKLKYLDKWTALRIRNARRYDMLFKKAGMTGIVRLPYIEEGNLSVFNQYVISVKNRDSLRAHLTEQGIGTEIYYPLPLHLQKCFKYLGCRKGDFPASEKAAKEVLALPIYPELGLEQQKAVVSGVAGFFAKGS
ncbi:MAG: DegT/DnrJ/EryC1/StrS family aminotransferase, partial [Deltaproteobacteria bacterium]